MLPNGFALQLRHPSAAAIEMHVGPRCPRWQLASCRQLLTLVRHSSDSRCERRLVERRDRSIGARLKLLPKSRRRERSQMLGDQRCTRAPSEIGTGVTHDAGRCVREPATCGAILVVGRAEAGERSTELSCGKAYRSDTSWICLTGLRFSCGTEWLYFRRARWPEMPAPATRLVPSAASAC